MTFEEFENYGRFSFENFVLESAKSASESVEILRSKLGGPPSTIHKNDIWLTVHHLNQAIGFIWIQTFPEKREALGYDIYLDEKFRSKGFGRDVMLRCGELLKKSGFNKVKICVYEHNKIAQSLYSSLGFIEEKLDSKRGQHYLVLDL